MLEWMSLRSTLVTIQIVLVADYSTYRIIVKPRIGLLIGKFPVITTHDTQSLGQRRMNVQFYWRNKPPTARNARCDCTQGDSCPIAPKPLYLLLHRTFCELFHPTIYPQKWRTSIRITYTLIAKNSVTIYCQLYPLIIRGVPSPDAWAPLYFREEKGGNSYFFVSVSRNSRLSRVRLIRSMIGRMASWPPPIASIMRRNV